MRTTLKSLVLAAALVCGSANAHNTDGTCSVEGAQMVVVGSFRFTSRDLMAYAEQSQAGGDVCTPKSCGIVDDHWSVATKRSFDYCEQIAPGSVALVTSPASYNDPQLHHTAYSFGPGTPDLQGVCMMCRLPSPSSPIKLPARSP